MPCVSTVGFLLLSISTIFPVVYYSFPKSFSQMKSSMMENVQRHVVLRWAAEEDKRQKTTEKIPPISESLMDNLLSRIKNTTFSEDIATSKNNYDIMSDVFWGINLALFGNSALRLYTHGFTLCAGHFLVMAITSVYTIFQFTFKDQSIPSVILKHENETILEKLWCVLGLQQTEEQKIIIPSQEAGTLRKFLNNVFPGVENNGSRFGFKEFVQGISDIIGLDYSSIISAVVMAYILACIAVYVYDIFLEDFEKRVWTDEEVLDDFTNNEPLYKNLLEWTPALKSCNYDEENNDPIMNLNANKNKIKIAVS